MKNILTATDLDNNNKEINRVIEERVIQFNKNRIRKALKEAKDLKRIELNDDSFTLSKEESEQLKLKIINDSLTEKFRENEKINLLSEKENYLNLRKNVEGLNQLGWDSIHIEKVGIQNHLDYIKFEDLLAKSTSYSQHFLSLRDKHLLTINEEIKQIPSDDEADLKSLEIILKLREMYEVTTDTDDFEIFKRFGTDNNTDTAFELSNIFLSKSNHSVNDNIVNNLMRKVRVGDVKTMVSLTSLVKDDIITNRMLGILFSNKYITNNEVTTFDNMFGTNIGMKYVYRTRTLGELFLEITNSEISQVSKANRQQIYMTYDGTRPEKDSYHKWNGLQVYDLDLKLWIKKSGGDLALLKEELHKYLSSFHWYLWICTSASGKGLHIYTKVTPPHHIYTNIIENEKLCKYWHQVNYLQKQSVIYDILHRLHNISGNGIIFTDFWKEEKGVEVLYQNNVKQNRYLDNIVSRITAGIRLSYDEKPFINYNFVDCHPGWLMGQTVDGYEYPETIENVFIQQPNNIRRRIDEDIIDEESKHKQQLDLSKYVTLGGDLTNVKPIHKSGINYAVRYNVCNTLASLFGKDGLPIAHMVLDSKGCNNIDEINSFYGCALSNGKEPSKLGLEVLKKSGIIKAVEEPLIKEVDTSFKGQIKDQIEKSIENQDTLYHVKLGDGFLSDHNDYLTEHITGSKINIILAPPGAGKTSWIKHLAKAGKKVMLVLPYVSVIRNKIETDDEISKLFDNYYGSKDLKEMEYGRNIVTTFDKFSRCNHEKAVRMFDYIFIDESHLLFTSSYRIEATSNTIKRIKEIFFVSSNDPFSAKMVLMTGTETGESFYFKDVGNIINVSKKQKDKSMEFLICNDTLDAITRLSDKASKLIQEGYRLMIPTNKGEIYSEKIIGMIEYILQRPVKYGYYKRSNTEQEICRLIDEHNSIGDYEIIFCSNYLSVGVDINDNHLFASIYLGNFAGYEIEQFNARIRKTGIKAIYCLPTQTLDGKINEMLLDEPNLLLKITDEDKLFFIDDRSIAEAKTEFIATYDPVLKKITTPGFSLFNGKIQFNLEEYELISFENKYNDCMEHPLKIARELSNYGYEIKVSTEFEGLSLHEQEKLKQMGIESAKNEKIRKHNLLVGTYVDLIKHDTYTNEYGLEFTNVIEWIGKNTDKIEEDRELVDDLSQPAFVNVIFDVFATPQKVLVRNKEAFDKMFRYAKYMTRRYSNVRAIDIIYQYVDPQGILKVKNFQRAVNLLKLIDNSDSNELSEPVSKTIEKIYIFVDKFEAHKDYRIGYETYQAVIDSWTHEYIDMLGIKVNTKYAWDKVRDALTEMLSDISTRQTSKNGIRFVYNKLPDQDSSEVLSRRSVDNIIASMFNVTEAIMDKKQKVREKHITLQKQDF